MLSQCANSQCCKPFLNLREGRLFAVDITCERRSGGPRHLHGRSKPQLQTVEHYWLCDACAAQWTLFFDSTRGIETIPLRKPMHTVRALEGIRSGMGKLRLAFVPPGA